MRSDEPKRTDSFGKIGISFLPQTPFAYAEELLSPMMTLIFRVRRCSIQHFCCHRSGCLRRSPAYGPKALKTSYFLYLVLQLIDHVWTLIAGVPASTNSIPD